LDGIGHLLGCARQCLCLLESAEGHGKGQDEKARLHGSGCERVSEPVDVQRLLFLTMLDEIFLIILAFHFLVEDSTS
jgi:hypothetical protein